jgi:hypothetical protein
LKITYSTVEAMTIRARESARPRGDWKPRNGTFCPTKPVAAVGTANPPRAVPVRWAWE